MSARFSNFLSLLPILSIFLIAPSFSWAQNVDVTTSWPATCTYQPQGVYAKNVVKTIDCNKSSVSYPGTTAGQPITAWGKCRYVDNASSKTYFIPLNTEKEWQSFIDHNPAGTALRKCSVCAAASLDVVYVVDYSISLNKDYAAIKSFFINLTGALDADANATTTAANYINNTSSAINFDSSVSVFQKNETDNKIFQSKLSGLPSSGVANGTCIGCGLNAAVNILDGLSDSNEKVIVLMTDGGNNVNMLGQYSGAFDKYYPIENSVLNAISTKGYRTVVVGVGNYDLPILESVSSINKDSRNNLFLTPDYSKLNDLVSSVSKVVCKEIP